MSNRLGTLTIGIGSLAVWCGFLGFLSGADKSSTNQGKQVADFALKDTKEQRISLAEFKDKKAVVVVFTGTECPINNAYMPRLADLHKTYASKGVQFLAINSNRQDTADKVAAHAKEFAIPFPVLKDEGSKVADQFGAERTPEAFVLDANRKICYQGRIDDQFGSFYKRGAPTRHDLQMALDEVLADKTVSQPSTVVGGCLISRAVKAKADATITYTKHVARIFQNNCQECHRPGEIGPFSLLTYDDATAWSGTIREVVHDGRMPPWFADPSHGRFSNDRRLPQQERETLLAWIEQGCPKGDEQDMPPPRQFTQGWVIGKPDMIFSMQEEFEVPAEAGKNGVPYKYFSIETNFKEDRWVERAEARPGSRSVVHHIVVFIAPPGQTFNPEQGGKVLVGTAPGDMPLILQPGQAKKIPAGYRLVFQMHYTPDGMPRKDRSSVGIIFAKEPPERQVFTMPVLNPALRIPPGEENHQVESEFSFKEDAHIIAFMPHMHLRGKDFLYEAVYPDGNKEILLSVPHYNFNWQGGYRLAEPKPMPKGSKLHCTAHFDNSSKNPNNPDPAALVKWGDQTWEEMMIGWMDFTYDRASQ